MDNKTNNIILALQELQHQNNISIDQFGPDYYNSEDSIIIEDKSSNYKARCKYEQIEDNKVKITFEPFELVKINETFKMDCNLTYDNIEQFGIGFQHSRFINMNNIYACNENLQKAYLSDSVDFINLGYKVANGDQTEFDVYECRFNGNVDTVYITNNKDAVISN